MNFKIFSLISCLVCCIFHISNVTASQEQNEEYDERCLSGIQTHLTQKLLEWGEITSKIPLEHDIGKNVLKIGIYITYKDPDPEKLEQPDQWMFIHKENELYLSGYCEHGDPRTVKTGRMKTAMDKIDKIPEFQNVQWKTLKQKDFLEHFEDFNQRGICLADEQTVKRIREKKKAEPKFDSTNYGHTEQAWLSDLLELEDLDLSEKYLNFKAVIAMSSSNITCDKCASSLAFSLYNSDFLLKERAIQYFAEQEGNAELIQDNTLVWNNLPEVSVIFSSYEYKDIDGIEKICHNKSYLFPPMRE